MNCHRNADIFRVSMTSSCAIRRLDFTFRDRPNSLRYDWIATDLDGRPVFEERYEYSPGAGLVGFTDRLT